MILKRTDAVKVERREFDELLRLHSLATEKQQDLLSLPTRGQRVQKQIYVWQKVAQFLRDALVHLEPVEQFERSVNSAGANEDQDLAF